MEPAISQMAKQEPGLSDTSYALVFAKLPKRVQREIVYSQDIIDKFCILISTLSARPAAFRFSAA